MMVSMDRMAGVCIVVVALPLWAQNFGEITGSLADLSGAVVGGAKITVTNSQEVVNYAKE